MGVAVARPPWPLEMDHATLEGVAEVGAHLMRGLADQVHIRLHRRVGCLRDPSDKVDGAACLERFFLLRALLAQPVAQLLGRGDAPLRPNVHDASDAAISTSPEAMRKLMPEIDSGSTAPSAPA
eukprot:CAMPEP_0119073624 /NCGR_PEP_ID=MMETSP1178-20130426/67349_1 /TAXON_ID=33656 /ORGANISM="unid sp, Strain CCMP2000" /LENGTH=123 /DNA_ID=CAMNT_0007055721 /DNA_START=99 /DNA_END=472 /DNA_ORIENTATION=-